MNLLSVQSQNKSHTFFEKVENSRKFSLYIPPYKLVMQTKGGLSEADAFKHLFGVGALKMGCSGCWLGTAGYNAESQVLAHLSKVCP